MTNHCLLPSPDALDHRSHSFHYLLLVGNSHHTSSRSLLTEEISMQCSAKTMNVQSQFGLTKINVMLPLTETIDTIMKAAPVLGTPR